MFKRLLIASSVAIAILVGFAPPAFATITQASPSAGFTYLNSVYVSWTTPSTRPPSALSMVWTYTSGPYATTEHGHQITLNLPVNGSIYRNSFSFSPASPTSSASISSVSGGPFYDGTYSVVMHEVEAGSGSNYTSSTATGVTVEFDTVPPSLTAPVVGSIGNTLPVAFDLPESPALAAGTVQLSLTNQATNAVTTLDLPSTQDQSFVLSPGNLGGGASATVASGPGSLADGTYSVVLSYANANGEPAASSTPLTWTLDTTTQTPQAPSVTGGTDGSAVNITYDLPETATPGSVDLVFTGSTTTVVSLHDQTAGSHTLTLDPSHLSSSADVASVLPANATLLDGSYTVAVAYQDALGNPVTTGATSNLSVTPVPAPTPTTPTTTIPTTPTTTTSTPTVPTIPTTSTSPTTPVPAPTPTTPTTSTTPTTETPNTDATTETSSTTATNPTLTTTAATAAAPAVASLGAACSAPSGRLAGRGLGQLALGMTRGSARALMPRYVVTNKGFDRFCLRSGYAARVVYASPHLLSWLPPSQRSPLRERIVLALTSNPFYTLDSITPGASLAAAIAELHLSAPLQIGLNTWYFVPGPLSDGVLKVRDGVVDEIGIASRAIADPGVRAQTMRSLWNTTPN